MSITGSRDKRREKGIESRKLIIESAVKCIATRGLCDTTLDRVAELAGVSRALVVFHFKSKNGMLKTVLEDMGARYHREWTAIMALPDLSAEQRLYQLILYDLRLPNDNPELIAVWYTFWGEARGVYREFNSLRDESYTRDMKVLIEQIRQSGEYRQLDAGVVSDALSALLYGLWLDAHLNPRTTYFDESLEVVNYFLCLNFPNHF